MLDIRSILVSPFMQNCRILHCSETNHAVLVDPGADAEIILKNIRQINCSLQAIWLTHSHLDHCGAVKTIMENFPVKLYGHKIESAMRANVEAIAGMYGIEEGVFDNCPEPDNYIEGQEELFVGKHRFKVIFTPGHSPGHVSFYSPENSIIISGDVLFSDSIGRTDLPGGDYNTLMTTIREKIYVLPPETKVLCGHGPDTTVAREMKHNPFITA